MGRFDIEKLRQPGDTFMDPRLTRPGDIVVPVMGPTGVGKSTFINNLLSDPTALAAVSDGFDSCTSKLSPYFIDIPPEVANRHHEVVGRRLVLVDTPGFDDTSLSDSEILRRIAVWLASSYSADMKVGGVVYLFPIYPNRITRNDRSNLKIFQKICGENSLSKIILGTTRWDICPPNSGNNRESELRTEFWANMIDQSNTGGAALMTRLEDNRKSAWGLIDLILGRLVDTDGVDGIIVDIQAQIVKKHKTVPETAAARELHRKLKELMKESGSGSPETRRQRLQALVHQAKELDIPLTRRILSFFGL